MPIINSTKAAQDLRESIGWYHPSDFSLEDVSNSLGVIIQENPIKGSEGRILINGNSGIVTINSSIKYSRKKNFIIAHELGHFMLHKNIEVLFTDTHKTLADWYKNGIHEQQANDFASELLMPSELYKQKVTNRKLNINLIEEIADFFQVSLTAAFLKYRILGSYPVMVIFIEDGIIRWKQCSEDFPFQYLPINSKVPVWTVAGDCCNGNGIENKPVKVDALEWFPEDFQIKHKKDWKLWEQCFRVSENGLLSCLWTY